MNKKYFLYAIVPALLLTSVGVAAYASQTQDSNPMTNLVVKIAQKFNLSQSDVQAVFDEYNTEMKTERDAKMEEMKAEQETKVKKELTALVTSGTLTQSQMDLILAKREELKSKQPAMEKPSDNSSATQKTKEELDAERETMKAKMEAEQTELKQWAKDNNISEEYLKYVKGFGGADSRGHGSPEFDKGNPSQPPVGEPSTGATTSK